MPWQGWSLGLVRVPGGGADFQGVHAMRTPAGAPVERCGGPAGVFFGVVAGFA